jgi:hypothetical protein
MCAGRGAVVAGSTPSEDAVSVEYIDLHAVLLP